MKRNSVDIKEKLEKIKSIVAEKKKEIEDKLESMIYSIKM
jgi:hypothetical protein